MKLKLERIYWFNKKASVLAGSNIYGGGSYIYISILSYSYIKSRLKIINPPNFVINRGYSA